MKRKAIAINLEIEQPWKPLGRSRQARSVQNHRRWMGHGPTTLDPYPSRHERGRWRPMWSHPKTHCPKHPPIKPTPKQPPNQHSKPPKHPTTTGEQSLSHITHGPQPTVIKAHYPWPRQVKQKPRNEKFSSHHCFHCLPTPAVVVPCFCHRRSLQAFELRETEPRCEREESWELCLKREKDEVK